MSNWEFFRASWWDFGYLLIKSNTKMGFGGGFGVRQKKVLPFARPWGFPMQQTVSQILIGCTCHVPAGASRLIPFSAGPFSTFLLSLTFISFIYGHLGIRYSIFHCF
jgi:hypothetical protein